MKREAYKSKYGIKRQNIINIKKDIIMKQIFENKKNKLVAILLTFAIVALSIFNVNIIQGNNGEVTLPKTIEQAEALADIEITITTYVIS
jgi:hypothetical protein